MNYKKDTVISRLITRIPLIKKEFSISIGIYTGESPLELSSPDNIVNPVLTTKDITDITAEFIADPFMVNEGSGWYMFFEVMDYHTHMGKIGLAVSNNGFNWAYKHIILDEPFHLSYPYVFKWENEYYMIPDCCQTFSIRLYKAVTFPTRWLFVKTLLNGCDYVDSSLLYFDNRWWLFTASAKKYNLYLYYADDIFNTWIEHPGNPIIKNDMNIAIPGGRILIFDNQIIRYAHCDYPTYGNKVYALRVKKLTTTTYEEEKIGENPVLKASKFSWNADGMHHIDPHKIDNTDKWIACVDGYKKVFGFSIQKLGLKLKKFHYYNNNQNGKCAG